VRRRGRANGAGAAWSVAEDEGAARGAGGRAYDAAPSWPWLGLELGKASPLAGSRGGGSDRPSRADAVARRREAACEGVGVWVATRARLVRRRLREWSGVE
jgi:hypothetical protein